MFRLVWLALFPSFDRGLVSECVGRLPERPSSRIAVPRMRHEIRFQCVRVVGVQDKCRAPARRYTLLFGVRRVAGIDRGYTGLMLKLADPHNIVHLSNE